MWQHYCHYSIRLQMIKVMQKEGIVSLWLWSETKSIKTRVNFFIRRVPSLRIRRIWYYSIHIQRFICTMRIGLIKVWPIFFQSISISCQYICRKYTTHYQIHSCKVICIRFQLLRIILYSVGIIHILCSSFSYIYKQTSASRRRIIYFNCITTF